MDGRLIVIGLVLALLGAVTAQAGPPLNAPKILDISEASGALDFEALDGAYVSAVIVRASHGATVDAQAVAYVGQLQAAGIPVPALYHEYDPAQPWPEQYDALAGVMDATGIERAAVRLGGDLTAPDLTGARAMLDELAEDYPLPVLYRHLILTDAAAWQALGSPAWGASYELWVIDHTPGAVNPVALPPWKTWRLWQYVEEAGPANGVAGAHGVSRFNGSSLQFESWLRMAWVRGEPQPR